MKAGEFKAIGDYIYVWTMHWYVLFFFTQFTKFPYFVCKLIEYIL